MKYQFPVSGKSLSSGTLEDERNGGRAIFIRSWDYIKGFYIQQHCRYDRMDTDLSFLSAMKCNVEFYLTPLPCALPFEGTELPDRKNRKELCSKCDMPKCYIYYTLGDN